jgi:ABC-type antimicrobial peptide transport system permease subunit
MEKTIELIDENLSYSVQIIGINISTLFNFYSRADLTGGYFPNSNSSPIECMIGSELQKFLSSLDILVNHTSLGFSQHLFVSGILQNANEFSHTILLNLDDYLTVFNYSSDEFVFQRVKILLKNGAFLQDTINDLQSSLNDRFPNLIIKPEKQADIFTASMFADILEQLNFLFIVLFIIALIRVFHSISWFLSNYEREFLIMKACGLSTFQLYSLVGILALIIGNAGLFVGLSFGLITPSIIFTLLNLFFQSSYVIPDFSPLLIFTVFILSNLIILAAATFPAVQLSFSKPNRLSSDTRGLER